MAFFHQLRLDYKIKLSIHDTTTACFCSTTEQGILK